MFLRIEKSLLFYMLLCLVSCTGIPVTSNQPNPTNPSIAAPTPSQIQATEQASPYPPLLPATATVPSLSSITPAAIPSATVIPTPDLPSVPPISHLHMFDANKGWTLHENSGSLQADDILMTLSGGLSWKNVSPVLPNGYYQGPAVSFVDDQHGIAVYVYYKELSPNPTDVRTWRTADGGRTWQAVGDLKVPTSMIAANQVILDTPQHGWFYLNGDASRAASPVILFETQDGGDQWNLVYNTDDSKASSEDELWNQYTSFSNPRFTFYTPTNGYFASGGLFATQDGGHTWHRQLLPPPAEIPDLEDQILHLILTDTLSTPQFSSAADGVLIRRVYSQIQVEQIGDYILLPEQEYLYFTHDGGKTWTPQPSPAKIGTVFFLDTQRGWYVGKHDTDPGALPQVYQTQDGGAHWSVLASKNAPPLGSEIQFVDDQIGFANSLLGSYYRTFDNRSGSEPQLYITKDGGGTWEITEFKLSP
jgi:photosystem II stability/assembly factor-like uncharacterized protein